MQIPYRTKGYNRRIVKFIVDPAHMIEALTMGNNFLIQGHIIKRSKRIRSIHQSFQVVEVSAHAVCARIISLILFIEKKGFLKECTCRRYGRYIGNSFIIDQGKSLADERGYSPYFERFFHRETAYLNLDNGMHI